jgi:hypothetical protein
MSSARYRGRSRAARQSQSQKPTDDAEPAFDGGVTADGILALADQGDALFRMWRGFTQLNLTGALCARFAPN